MSETKQKRADRLSGRDRLDPDERLLSGCGQARCVARITETEIEIYYQYRTRSRGPWSTWNDEGASFDEEDFRALAKLAKEKWGIE